MNATVRKYIYSIVLAVGPVILFYGLLSSEELAVWTGLVATLLQTPVSGLALKNLTPDAEYQGKHEA